MKLTRSIMVVLVGLSLSAPSAHACEIPGAGFFTWLYSVCHHEGGFNRECDQNGQNSGTGRNCDHGRGNGGGYCGTSGSGNTRTGSGGPKGG
jgi:hypothetical protein